MRSKKYTMPQSKDQKHYQKRDSIDDNPDVAEVLLYNKLGCKHLDVKLERRCRAVGAGGGLIGCHMEDYWVNVCTECKEVVGNALDPYWAQILSTLLPAKNP